jgi:hypothetical protein
LQSRQKHKKMSTLQQKRGWELTGIKSKGKSQIITS